MLAWLSTALLVALAAVPCDGGPCRGRVVHYEPAPVVVSGTLVMEHVYGPPNYGENPHQDAQYVIPVLHLDSGLCVLRDSTSELNGDTFSNVRRLQLLAGSSPLNFEAFARHRVMVYGTLSESVTPGIYTHVYVNVSRIEPAPL